MCLNKDFKYLPLSSNTFLPLFKDLAIPPHQVGNVNFDEAVEGGWNYTDSLCHMFFSYIAFGLSVEWADSLKQNAEGALSLATSSEAQWGRKYLVCLLVPNADYSQWLLKVMCETVHVLQPLERQERWE